VLARADLARSLPRIARPTGEGSHLSFAPVLRFSVLSVASGTSKTSRHQRRQLQFHDYGIEGTLCVSDSEQKYSGDNFRGAEHASPYPVSRLGAPVSLVDMAKVIESASAKVALRTNAQLEVIVEQMKALQERAREIIEQASRDVDLIHAECRFHRVAGRVYHLYERPDGHRFFSMLGPDDYGGAGPTGFVASFRYEHDESWTRLDEIDGRDRRRAEIQGFVSNRLLARP